MRWLFTAFVVVVSLSAIVQTAAAADAYDSVNPFIGTADDGNTFPAATLPFGMMQWGPDTRDDGWYHYRDKTIRGFSLTHISGAGCAVYADLPILPWNGDIGLTTNAARDYALPFSHDREQAHPGYYSVQFDDGIGTELTVSSRAGMGRFTFPQNIAPRLIFKAGASATSGNRKRTGDTSTIDIEGHDTVTGTIHSGGFCESDTNYVLYFAAKFAKPFSDFGSGNGAPLPGVKSASGHDAIAYVSFPQGSAAIIVKIGISFVSIDNAEENLAGEIPGWDFDQVHTAARADWTRMLDRVRAEGGTPAQRTIFYTGLYHMLLSPTVFSDEIGDYIGFDGKVRRLPHGQAQYANFSDWDIYRSLIQFQSLLMPEQTSQMMQSLVRDAEQSGWLPRWPVANDVSYVMGGDSSAILLSEAYSFGATSFDQKSALRFMIKGATQPGTGLHGGSERPSLQEYLKNGYVPVTADQEAGASITLEYGNADFADSRFASALGDQTDAHSLLQSAQKWKTLFDPDSKFIRPRSSDGKFLGGWDPDKLLPHHIKTWDKLEQLGFEEGNTWQYTWMIPYDYAGLFQAMGGDGVVVPRLDKFFEKLSGWNLPNFTVANEPDFCAPYAYLWAGTPWKTQEVIDRIRRETFMATPDGLPGNDDLGATSGVYVWNALGMYPVIPGVAGVALGTPMFSKVIMQLGGGKGLEIVSRGEGIYVQSVELNGKSFRSAWLPLSALAARDNRLEFELGDAPNKSWAIRRSELPPSFDVPGR